MMRIRAMAQMFIRLPVGINRRPTVKVYSEKSRGHLICERSSPLLWYVRLLKKQCIHAHIVCVTGYATSDGKPRAIADASHIRAASKGGPRGTSSITSKKLSSADNGIWLCKVCHSEVDNDPARFDVDLLRKMKADHEEVIRRIVGKDLEAALLDLRNHKRYHDEAREFISYIENKRVMYEGLDHEDPLRVLESLGIIRERIIQTRAKVNPDSHLFTALYQMQKVIDNFLRDIGKDTDLRTLRCSGDDPVWSRFADELVKLRSGMIIICKVLAGDADYKHTWL